MLIKIFKQLFISLIFSVAVVSIMVFTHEVWAAWTNPTDSPPNANVSIPISKDASGNVIIQLGI